MVTDRRGFLAAIAAVVLAGRGVLEKLRELAKPEEWKYEDSNLGLIDITTEDPYGRGLVERWDAEAKWDASLYDSVIGTCVRLHGGPMSGQLLSLKNPTISQIGRDIIIPSGRTNFVYRTYGKRVDEHGIYSHVDANGNDVASFVRESQNPRRWSAPSGEFILHLTEQ